MSMFRLCCLVTFVFVFSVASTNSLSAEEKWPLCVIGSADSDLCQALQQQEVRFQVDPIWQSALTSVKTGGAIAVLAEGYPESTTDLPQEFFRQAAQKGLRVYIEFPGNVPGVTLSAAQESRWERVVVSSSTLSSQLEELRILSMNRCRFIPMTAENPLMVLARVAGFETAVYGIPESAYPLLVHLPATSERPEMYVASSKMSAFVTARYAPAGEWQKVWQALLGKLMPKQNEVQLTWTPTVRPTYDKQEILPLDAEHKAFQRGARWYLKSGLLLTPQTEEITRLAAAESEVTNHKPYDDQVGDGNLGMLEGFDSGILPDGSQRVRVILRSDCISESAMALGIAGDVLDDEQMTTIAKNLQEYLYERSGAVHGDRGDPEHPSYGMIAWGVTNEAWMRSNYGDDIARVVLSTLSTGSTTDDYRWSPFASRAIISNLRSCGPYGFRPANTTQSALTQNGWKHYFQSSTVNLAPHFQCYIWACYLAAYQHTGDELLLQRAKTGLRVMMTKYPDHWRWTNGLQQERARLLLPLAWLVRVEDTPEHRQWLRRIAEDVVACQDESGAIREELGRLDHGGYPPHRDNESFGAHEAPLIHENGEPVSDLLYSTNFAFLGLHEAAAATGDPFYREAEDRLAKFLCRIQTSSQVHPELDGAWMRAFDFDRWEYWGSNGDAGWGAWSIESGWTQGWIVTVLGLRIQQSSLWESLQKVDVAEAYQKQRPEMISQAEIVSLKQDPLPHDARYAKVDWQTTPSENYSFFGPDALTDGLVGSLAYRDVQWTGIEGEPLIVTIDLGRSVSLDKVSVHALQSQPVGIYFPISASVAVSQDGDTFAPWNKAEWKSNDGVEQSQQWFQVSGEQVSMRYLRMTIDSRGIVPNGKQAAGKAAWLFVDEIAVNPDDAGSKEVQ